MKKEIYTDILHGFRAEASDFDIAWRLIRNKCHELNLKVPLMTEIKNSKNQDIYEVRGEE